MRREAYIAPFAVYLDDKYRAAGVREYSFSEPVRAGIYEDLVIDLSGLLPHHS